MLAGVRTPFKYYLCYITETISIDVCAVFKVAICCFSYLLYLSYITVTVSVVSYH